jgi:CheY-like chemotaxis protein
MNARILVVEDDQVFLPVVSAVRDVGGDHVERARDGSSAIARLHADRFDLVLLGDRISGRDATAIAAMIRDLPGDGGRPRLVALTVLPDFVVGRELLAGVGRDGAPPENPFDLPELLALLTRQRRAAPGGVAGSTLLVQAEPAHGRRRRPERAPRRRRFKDAGPEWKGLGSPGGVIGDDGRMPAGKSGQSHSAYGTGTPS